MPLEFAKLVKSKAEELSIGLLICLKRDLNVNYSGGEKKETRNSTNVSFKSRNGNFR